MMATEPKIVAVVYDKDGKVYDRCWTWESGQTYANRGYVVKATAADGHVTKSKAQSLYDYELELFKDCWTRDHYFEN